MSRLITLQDWAKEEFGDLAPSERVLKKYAQGKMMAEVVNKNWPPS